MLPGGGMLKKAESGGKNLSGGLLNDKLKR